MLREEEGREGGPVGTLSPKRETSSRSQRARGEEKEEDKTDEDDDGVDRQHNNITTSERILTSLDSFLKPDYQTLFAATLKAEYV